MVQPTSWYLEAYRKNRDSKYQIEYLLLILCEYFRYMMHRKSIITEAGVLSLNNQSLYTNKKNYYIYSRLHKQSPESSTVKRAPPRLGVFLAFGNNILLYFTASNSIYLPIQIIPLRISRYCCGRCSLNNYIRMNKKNVKKKSRQNVRGRRTIGARILVKQKEKKKLMFFNPSTSTAAK